MIGQARLTDGAESFSSDLTPMLDILFILLVFFMLTTGVSLRSLELELPQGASEQLAPTETKQVVVEVSKEYYLVDGRRVETTEDVRKLLRQQTAGEFSVVVASDREAPVQGLITLLSMLQSESIQTASILMEEEK